MAFESSRSWWSWWPPACDLTAVLPAARRVETWEKKVTKVGDPNISQPQFSSKKKSWCPLTGTTLWFCWVFWFINDFNVVSQKCHNWHQSAQRDQPGGTQAMHFFCGAKKLQKGKPWRGRSCSALSSWPFGPCWWLKWCAWAGIEWPKKIHSAKFEHRKPRIETPETVLPWFQYISGVSNIC